MFIYTDNTNYNLNSYAFIVLIYLKYHLFLCLTSVMTPMNVSRSPITATSFHKISGVIERVEALRAREITARGV
jgi:hypothetical protein